jgi:heme o synthase
MDTGLGLQLSSAERAQPLLGPWARLLAFGAVAGTALAVISGAAGWDTAHRVLAAVAVPPLAALVVLTWLSARRIFPVALSALILFGAAALLVGRDVHLVFAALAFGATMVTWVQVMRGATAETGTGAWRDYVTLTKPRVMSLLLLTGAAGAFVGAQAVPALDILAIMLIGLALACGGASALNHYLDRDIDKLMGSRTASRPVASGRLAPEYALEFGVALCAISFVLLDSLVNFPTAALALAGGLFYVFVYTLWLKRTTPQNIVIGGAAGAVPPLVGYASVTGHIGLAAIAMFGIVFLWTPPHFWALALMLKDHYANARVPMLPVVRGDRETARQVFWYTLVLVAATLVPAAFGTFGLVYGVSALVLGAMLTWLAIVLWRATTKPNAVRLFHFSMLYLALLFVAMAVDAVV